MARLFRTPSEHNGPIEWIFAEQTGDDGGVRLDCHVRCAYVGLHMSSRTVEEHTSSDRVRAKEARWDSACDRNH